jgi:DNA-binding transcriptional LysR family regulator
MELMQLEMFVAVVEERSFLGAAERVFRTQPAVSIGLRKLEGKIGVPLLDRSQRRSGRLTAAGEVLYEYATRILGLRDEALSVLKEEKRSCAKRLRVGLASGENCEWILQLSVFNRQYPDVRLEILCDRSDQLFRDLTDQQIDIAVVSGRPKTVVQSKNLIATRVRGLRPLGSLWVLRPRLGGSPLGHAFEESLVGHFKNSTNTASVRRREVRNFGKSELSARTRLVYAKKHELLSLLPFQEAHG